MRQNALPEDAFPCSGCRGQIRTKAKTIDTNTNQFIKVYHILDKMQYKITKIFKVMKRPSYGDNLTSYLANET